MKYSINISLFYKVFCIFFLESTSKNDSYSFGNFTRNISSHPISYKLMMFFNFFSHWICIWIWKHSEWWLKNKNNFFPIFNTIFNSFKLFKNKTTISGSCIIFLFFTITIQTYNTHETIFLSFLNFIWNNFIIFTKDGSIVLMAKNNPRECAVCIFHFVMFFLCKTLFQLAIIIIIILCSQLNSFTKF